MELRRDLFLGVGSILTLSLLIALVTIAVFSRMGPVIDRIMRENVYSTQAAGEMLAVLARASDRPLEPREREAYAAGLQRVQSNLTAPEEKAPLARLGALLDAVLAGEPGARREASQQLEILTAVNHRAMNETAREARRLGLAGAWFSVFVASFALILSVLAVRRLTQRLLAPVRELAATLEAARAGNLFRRCLGSNLPLEFARIFTQINEMLDHRRNPRPYTDRRAQADHAVVLWSLRQRKDPTFVVDEAGKIFAANGPAHALLGDPRGPTVRAALGAGRQLGGVERKLPEGMSLVAESVPEGDIWICEVRGTGLA